MARRLPRRSRRKPGPSPSASTRRRRKRPCRRSSKSASLISRVSKHALLVRLLPALVAVDVGHYHGEPGVISASGIPEFEFNLKLALEVKGHLEKSGMRVRLIGEKGKYVFHNHRNRAAAGYDLLISI